MSDLTERRVQDLIFEYPWLLDLNYEIVHELSNKGYEHVIDDTRIDILFRHKLNGRPVIVEFKKGGFYRDNIGQVLEYRTRILLELKNNYSGIEEVFGNKLLAPILCLVVKDCSDEARIACNLSGIELYEYHNYVNKMMDINRNGIEEVEKSFKNELFISYERYELVERFYSDLKKELDREKISEKAMWKTFKASAGEYWHSYQHMFINKWLFDNQDVSIGIYENIIKKGKPRFVFGLYGSSEDKLLPFLDKWRKQFPEIPLEKELISIDDERYAEIYLEETSEKDAIDKYLDLIKKYITIGYKER